MTIKDLYRYVREDGGITVATEKPENIEYEITYRLIADDGMELVKGDIRACCIDTDDINEWTEETVVDKNIEDFNIDNHN